MGILICHKGDVVLGRINMRGQVDPQSHLFSYFSVEQRIPADHPLRRIKAQADSVLGEATDIATEAISKRFGRSAVDGKIQAHIVTIES